ncbi:MAG: alpha-2-macroglobulin family protein [Kofleriaceae bacterium]
MSKPSVRLLSFAAVLALAPGVRAGGGGTIEGSVVGQSGAALASGVKVTVTCGAVTKTATVDGAGAFRVSGLPAGRCTVTGQGAGFATVTLAVIVADDAIATVLVGMAPPRPPPPPMEDWIAVPAAMAPELARPPVRRMAKAAPEPSHAPAPKLGQGAAPAKDRVPMRPPPPPRVVRLDEGAMGKKVAIDRRAQARLEARDPWAGDAADDDALQLENTWAPVRVFPVPLYTAGYDGPRTDFRETIYWNPTVETDARGEAQVRFVASDAVTSFRVTAEGFADAGSPGRGQATFQSKLPLTLDAHLPVEVTAGDRIDLPVTVVNDSERDLDAVLDVAFGTAFKLGAAPPARLRLKAGERRAMFFPVEVVATDGDAAVSLAVTGQGQKDEVTTSIRVVPRGFPLTVSAAGTASSAAPARHTLDLAGALPGSFKASVTMYPSALASMTKGMEGMIREPGGCFEQTSSTNYPNIMVLAYLQSSDAAEPALVERSQAVLDRGYQLLTGYETSQRGYEWFGQTPGHEALTAYGLMEFADMAKVYDVDQAMVDRTAAWLMQRRDGKGGFRRSSQALDSFGRADEVTTNAYIMWALAEAGRTDELAPELAVQAKLGASTKDPYLLALAASTNLTAAPTAPATAAMVKKLAGLQAADGSFPGAAESITKSGGQSLVIETTSLAVLALLQAGDAYAPQVRAAVDFLNGHRGGYGDWGNTQATILGLKALTAYAEHSKQMAASGSATLVVNGKPAGTITFDKGRREALVWDDFAALLRPGSNDVKIELAGGATLPYAVAVEYRSAQPPSSAAAQVALTTSLGAATTKAGEGVTLTATVTNTTDAGLPMTLARVGIPGGTVFQTWQLKELRDKGLIDFYETRPREVILYWRALAPGAVKAVDLNLLAAVPGSYQAPASSAYLYYTAEDKAWTAPASIAITR